MKRRVITALSVALLFGSPVIAQQYQKPAGDERSVSSTDPAGEMKTSEGTVKEFEAGKKLVLTSIDKKTLTFKLDQKGLTLSIDPSVTVGSHVKVTEQKVGETTSLTVEPVPGPLASSATDSGSKS